MASYQTKMNKLVGLCTGCDLKLYRSIGKPAGHFDFAGLPDNRRDVLCYRCGPGRVDVFGYKIGWLRRLMNKLSRKRFSK